MIMIKEKYMMNRNGKIYSHILIELIMISLGGGDGAGGHWYFPRQMLIIFMTMTYTIMIIMMQCLISMAYIWVKK